MVLPMAERRVRDGGAGDSADETSSQQCRKSGIVHMYAGRSLTWRALTRKDSEAIHSASSHRPESDRLAAVVRYRRIDCKKTLGI